MIGVVFGGDSAHSANQQSAIIRSTARRSGKFYMCLRVRACSMQPTNHTPQADLLTTPQPTKVPACSDLCAPASAGIACWRICRWSGLVEMCDSSCSGPGTRPSALFTHEHVPGPRPCVDHLSARTASSAEMAAQSSAPAFGASSLPASATTHFRESSAFVTKTAANDCGCVRPYVRLAR